MNISIHVILRLYSRAELKQCRLASSGWTSYEHAHTHTHKIPVQSLWVTALCCQAYTTAIVKSKLLGARSFSLSLSLSHTHIDMIISFCITSSLSL